MNKWTGWTARIVQNTQYGTYAVLWENAPAMERRGGVSSPFRTVAEARECIAGWLDSWDMKAEDCTIVEDLTR